MNMRSGLTAAAGLLMLSLGGAQAQALNGDNDMPLYTFDKDTGGVSTCYDDCAKNWPPYLVKAEDQKGEGWSVVERKDGEKQWAYKGKPVYYFAQDTHSTNANGDGLKGEWHQLMQQ